MKYIKPISFEETSCRTGAKELSEELEEGEQSGAYSSKIIILVVFNCKISILCILICRIHVNVVLGGGRWIPLPCETIFARNNGTNLRTIYLDTRRCMAEMRGYYIRSSPLQALCNTREQQTLQLSKVRRDVLLVNAIHNAYEYVFIYSTRGELLFTLRSNYFWHGVAITSRTLSLVSVL